MKKNIAIIVLSGLCVIMATMLSLQHVINEELLDLKWSVLVGKIDIMGELQQKDIHLAEMLGDLDPEHFQVIEIEK